MKLKPYLVIALLLIPFPQAMAQQPMYRLVGKIHQYSYINPPELTTIDSIRYIYNSNDIGSVDEYDSTAYHKKVRYVYNSAFRWVVLEDEVHNTFTADNKLSVQSYFKASFNGATTQEQVRDSFFYTNGILTAKHRAELNLQNALKPKNKMRFFYNANGSLSLIDSIILPADTATYKHMFEYDAYNNLTLDSLSEWTGWVTGIGWRPSAKTRSIYTYNAKRRLQQKIVIDTDSAIYDYDEYGQLAKYTRKNITRTYAYSSSGQLLSDTTINSNKAWEIVVHEYKYTYFDAAEEVNIIHYDTVMNLLESERIFYYYEFMQFPVSTTHTTSSNTNLTIYPVPTANMLNLRWDVKQPTQVQGRIVNNMGQTVQQWSDKVDGVYAKQILTHNLPNGMYYVILQADGVEMKKSFVIAK